MKIAGIILLIFGIFDFIIGMIGLSTEFAEQAGGNLVFGILLAVLGIMLIDRANKKRQKEQERERWSQGN